AAVIASASAFAQDESARAEYRRLVRLFRAGDQRAARGLAEAGVPMPKQPCRGSEECEAAAVLNLDAAALLLEAGRAERATALVDATRPLASRQAATFTFDWLLAAGYLHQGYGNHAWAFEYYAAALGLRPGDPTALLARATALEFSVLPDGFGGLVVADRDVWRLLEPGGEPPRELAYQLANARSEAPYRRLLLEFVTRQYRDVLARDPAQAEARLRLGRVLLARGHRAEAEPELRMVAAGTTDPFLAGLARLCLARLEPADAAAAAYHAALEVDPSLRSAWLGLSRALHGSGDREGAVAAVGHALSPEEPGPLDAWVEYHLGRGRAYPETLARLRARLTHPD
ncbi:MAG TPA: tetratricopeptide repeat protein, partial [Vicinamibacteria bacterium]|nr:tetratricopeptide repeat protein [Vicinamibacteria bacterium]